MSTLIRPAFVRRGNISSHHQVRAITRNNKSIGHYWKQFHSSSSKYATVSSALDGLYSLLNYKERQLLTEQRQLTETARQLAGQVGGSAVSELLHNTASLNFLQELRLQSTFSVVIAGEFNAGKSTLINALLGNQLLESGALPTTDTIHIVANAREHQEAEKNDDDQLLENNNNKNSKQDTNSLPLGVTLHLVPDMPLLQDVTLIDTPGTNSAWMDHTARTLRLLPSADLILFVTSADRPFSESERSLMKSIQAYRKSIVVLINKMDILDDTPDAKTKIIDFVTDHASELLGARPIVIPISSRTALSAKLQMKTTDDSENNNEDPTGLWNASNFASLESFLRDSLTTQTRIRSKLTSPIGVAEGLMVQCLETLKQEKEVLQADISTLNILKSQLEGWQKELNADLNTTKTTMTSMIQKEGERFEMLLSRMNLFNFYMWTLPGNPKHFNAEWQETKRQASLHRQKDLEAELLEQVYETADSVASRGRAQSQVVTEYLGNRPAMKNQSLIGSVTATSRFENTRKTLGNLMSEAVQSTLEGTHNDTKEQYRLFLSLRQLAMASAVMHTGWIGTGAVSIAELLDPMIGLAMTSGLFLGGNAFYFVGTSRLSKTYRGQWTNRAQLLSAALDAIYSKELDKVNRRIFDGVAPYTRFVESEQGRIDQLRDDCEGVATAARSLRNKIGKLA